MKQAVPLRVWLSTPDAARRGWLAAVLAEAGHRIAPEGAGADVRLLELPAHGPAPSAGAPPALVLSDRPDLLEDQSLQAVLPRAATPSQLDAAVRAVAAGLQVRPPRPAAIPGFAAEEELTAPLLTPREMEVLAAIGAGLSNKEIARRLEISVHTVKFHLESVFEKLAVGSRAEAVVKGLRRGLIEI